jgi:DNA-binding IclR family transcriptional regulator
MKTYPLILVLEKAIRLLGRFDADRTEWGVTELSRELEINKSTVSKILSTFENNRFLVKNSENRKYRLGLRLFELGSLVADQMDLQKVAYPYMEELNRKVKETVHLVVMDDFEIVYINKVESLQSLRIGTRVGGRLPAYCTGVGKVLLAALPSKELNLFLKKNPLKRFTTNTITDPEKLKESLTQIRAQGYALDLEEFSQGLMCVASPIFNYSQKEIGAISISGPSHRMQEKNLEYLIALMKSTAQQISLRLGYNGGKPNQGAA